MKSAPRTHASSGFTPRTCPRLPNEEPKGPSPQPGTRRSPCCGHTGQAHRRSRPGTPRSPGAAEPGGPTAGRWASQSVTHAARGVPSSRLSRRAKRSRSPSASRPARRSGPVALTSRRGRQRRRSQAASPQQQSPQLTRHVCPNQVPRAAARAGTEAFLRRRVMTSRAARGGGGGAQCVACASGGRGFRGPRETDQASGRDLRDIASCCQGRRAERGIPDLGQVLPQPGGSERTAPGQKQLTSARRFTKSTFLGGPPS